MAMTINYVQEMSFHPGYDLHEHNNYSEATVTVTA